MESTSALKEELQKISRDTTTSFLKSEQNLVMVLRQNHSELQESIAKLQMQLIAENKQRRLEFAIANAPLNSFDLVDIYNRPINSLDICRQVLFSFNRGRSHVLPHNMYYLLENQHHSKLDKGAQGRFRLRLAQQVEELTGVLPRYEMDAESETWTVQYS
jgi:hypothetical protein